MVKVGLSRTGMVWNGESHFFAPLKWFARINTIQKGIREKKTRRRNLVPFSSTEEGEKNEGFPRPVYELVATGNKAIDNMGKQERNSSETRFDQK
jgi:hypothetical protein